MADEGRLARKLSPSGDDGAAPEEQAPGASPPDAADRSPGERGEAPQRSGASKEDLLPETDLSPRDPDSAGNEDLRVPGEDSERSG